MPIAPIDVRFRGWSGHDVLILSLPAFDHGHVRLL